MPTRTLPRLQHACPDVSSNYTTVARSVDLAPIEHVWDILERNVKCRHDIRTRPQMIIALRRECAAISQNDIRAIIGSMRRRCTPVCGLMEAVPLIKQSVTFKNDPYPVL